MAQIDSSSSFERVFQSAKERGILLLDGGTGEELFRLGVPDDRKIWSATAVVKEEYHSVLKEVHRSFLEAGADAITTNSYGVVPGVGFEVDEIVRLCSVAGRLAREVVSEEKYSGHRLVFGSLGPLVESYRPDLIMEHAEGAEVYEQMAGALEPHVDAFLAETLSSVEESMQVVHGVGALKTSKSCLVSFTLASDGNLRSGEAASSAIPRLLDYARQHKVKGKSFHGAMLAGHHLPLII